MDGVAEADGTAPAEDGRGSGAPGWLRVAVVVAAGVWVVGVTVGVQVGGWLVDQLLAVEELRAGWIWPIGGVLNAGLVLAVTLPVAAVSRRPGLRAAGRAWSAAGVLLAVLGPVRWIPVDQAPCALATLAVLTWGVSLAALVVRRRVRRRNQRAGRGAAGYGRGGTVPARDAVPLAVAAGLVGLLPWVWLGALGGVLETVLAVLAAGGLGALSGTVLGARFWGAYLVGPGWRRVLGGGAAAGVALVPLVAGIGQGGAQLALLLVVPPLGLVAGGLYRDGTAGRVVGVLVGLVAVGPLALFDPAELSLVLGTDDAGYWALVAAGLGLGVALLAALVYGVALRRVRLYRWLAAGVAVLALLAGGAVYATEGHPGWYGDRLFVVLRARANLAGVVAIADRVARVREVYRRLVDTAQSSQRPLRRKLAGLGLKYTPYYLVNGIEVDGGGPVLRAWLAAQPGVDRVLLSPRLRPIPRRPALLHGTAATPGGPQWNVKMLGADRVASVLHVDGHGIVVGTSDSGVDGRHPALAKGFRGGNDSWYDPWYGSRSPTDYDGHGTHTLGSAVGRNGIGVAPGARWIGCVNLGRNMGSPARYLDCLQFMLAPFRAGGNPFTDGNPARAPEVLTNSWACPRSEGCDAGALRPAADALVAAGIFVVAAAGNTGPRCRTIADPPAPYPDVLTVGAVDRQRRAALFSSRGPVPGAAKPDVMAPGAGILSALPGGGYGRLDGTSMATPQVAGVVALMWSANPALIGHVPETARILERTATPAGASYLTRGPADRCHGERNITGAGLVDGYAAVQAAIAWRP